MASLSFTQLYGLYHTLDKLLKLRVNSRYSLKFDNFESKPKTLSKIFKNAEQSPKTLHTKQKTEQRLHQLKQLLGLFTHLLFNTNKKLFCFTI